MKKIIKKVGSILITMGITKLTITLMEKAAGKENTKTPEDKK